MSEENYSRQVQTAVNVFIYYGDEYLMLQRSPKKRVDPNKLNGIGGRLELKENFLDCAVREIYEEAGIIIKQEELEFCGLSKLELGYSEDWFMSLFRVKVESKKLPKGSEIEDGKLIWINKDKVLDSGYEVVEDLAYLWKDIVEGTHIFFANFQFNSDEKIESVSLSKIRK